MEVPGWWSALDGALQENLCHGRSPRHTAVPHRGADWRCKKHVASTIFGGRCDTQWGAQSAPATIRGYKALKSRVRLGNSGKRRHSGFQHSPSAPRTRCNPHRPRSHYPATRLSTKHLLCHTAEAAGKKRERLSRTTEKTLFVSIPLSRVGYCNNLLE